MTQTDREENTGAAVNSPYSNDKKAIALINNSTFNIKKLTITSVICLVLSGAAAGQDLPTRVSTPVPQPLAVFGMRLKPQLTPTYPGKTGNPGQAGASPAIILPAAYSEPVMTPTGARLITLQQVQQKAAPAGTNPL